MPEQSGVGETSKSRFGGSAGVRTLGDAFQPNLAMGGGTFRVPIDLPSGPAGLTPKVELTYDTAAGNGPFGLGWNLSLPFISRRRPRPFATEEEPEYAIAGGAPLVPTTDGDFVPSVAERAQRFQFDGSAWQSRTLELAELHFGSSADSRVEAEVGATVRTERWYLDRMRFPGGREIVYEYHRDGNQLYPLTIRWSVFELRFLWQGRPDAWSQFDAGFELRTARRCERIEVHDTRLGPHTLTKSFDFSYGEARFTRISLLERVAVTGWRRQGGAWQTAALPPLEFAYTQFSPEARRIERFRSAVVPPPSLSEDTTLVDLGGTSLPGVLRLNHRGATYWENRGGGRFGPPQNLAQVPAGIALSDPGVRFADMEGRGKADLVVARAQEGGYYPNQPGDGFGAKRTVTLQPSFDLGEADSHLMDLDGDRVADLLTFRGRTPMAFLNRGGRQWDGPFVLQDSGLPPDLGSDPTLRFADMTGDGLVDLVRLRSRRITYWPNLGGGRWGAERTMAETPPFDSSSENVLLGDVNGNGAADLIVHSGESLHIFMNRAGEGFSEPFTYPRGPRPTPQRTLLADMKGSGTTGLLFMAPPTAQGAQDYWYLDLLDAVKPNLLERIDNNAGLLTEVVYSTSAAERTRDLDAGRRWSGYLPFVVSVVKRLTVRDTVTGQTSTSDFDYHDGHFDGSSREYLGFAEVDSKRTASSQEEPECRRLFYHTRHTTARDPAFIAGRGQPHCTELLDPVTDQVRRLEEAEWVAIRIPGTSEERPGWLALQRTESNQQFEEGVVYMEEQSTSTFDAVGNTVRELRRSEWTDGSGNLRVEELTVETEYAAHPIHGPTAFKARVRKSSGGVLLKEMRHHYDGDPFMGLPMGQVERGFQTRQVEVALTEREVQQVYGGVLPAALSDVLEVENDPTFGTLYLRATGRARVDGFGNEVETIDGAGLRRVFAFDAHAVHPVSIAEDGGAPRPITFDLITQQVSRAVDLNGQVTTTEYDPLGFITAVYRPGAVADHPTEEYEYLREQVPTAVVQRVRVQHGDPEPGFVSIDYYDGCARRCQTKILSEQGSWAVGRQEILSVDGRKLGTRDAYFSFASDYDVAPPPGTASTETHYDFLGRVRRERLFNGRWTTHRYNRNRVAFFNPDAADLLEGDPSTPATRESVLNAQGLVTMLIEHDGNTAFTTHREYDPLQRLLTVVDPAGHETLANTYDLWGNRIRIRSSEGGETIFVFDAGNHEIRRTDADGRVLVSVRDVRGRVTELREGPSGATVLERYHYDAGAGSNVAGRLARVEGDFGTVRYSYSATGKTTEIHRTIEGHPDTFTTRFAYNNRDEVTQVVYPDGSAIDYTFNPTGTLAAIPGFIDSIDYGPTGLRERIGFANGLETRRRYTPGDYLLTEVMTQVQGGGPRYQHLMYTLDAVGQAVQVDDLSNVPGKVRLNQSYAYDARNRLVAATSNVAGFDYAYTYDDLGNLTVNGETGDEFVYAHEVGPTSNPNRLVRRRATADTEYTYDASGNLTSDPELGTLTYDARHRLVQVERPDGMMIEYTYDHNDRRVRTTVTGEGTVETRLEIEGLFLVEEGGASKVVFDEDRRMAVIPAAGDAMLHHYDRLGNVNVLSNAKTGAFAGHDEYTPYGQLFVSVVIEPAFSFQGGRFTDGLGIVLLGARFYRPDHGRFLNCDPYLFHAQEKIPPLHAALNLYLYAYANPTNFTDPTGEIALLTALIVAAIVGAVIGAVAAAANGAQTWEEVLLYIVGGAIGGVLTTLFWYGVLIFLGVAALTAATAAVVITAVASLASLFTPLLDESNSGVAWAFSWAIKLVKSPVFTILGLFVVAGFAIAGNRVDFRRGALFVETGGGMAALTLGAIVYTQSGFFQADGTVRDDFARHEAYHTRQVAALGEWGFYFTYLTFGSIFAAASGGPWNALDASGCGNPLESHAYTFYNPNVGGPSTVEVGVTNC